MTHRPRYALLHAAFFLSAAVLWAAPSRAQDGEADSMERAREHFAAGQALTNQGLYNDAYAEFAAGYGLSQRPLFLFNMAECAREVMRFGDARRDYERYLAADPEGTMAEVAQARLRALPNVVGAEADASPRVSPEDAARSLPPESSIPSEPSRPLRQKWQFWTVVGASLVGIGIIIGLGVGLSGEAVPACGMNCVDFGE